MNPQFAILVDGGFMRHRLRARDGRRPDADAIATECRRIAASSALACHDLLRIYFYDAPPAQGVVTNPLDGTSANLGRSVIAREVDQLFHGLETMPDFALRLGETVTHGWQIEGRAFEDIIAERRAVRAGDLVPRIEQKGVDLRIGLDIARLSLRGMVRAIVVVTGDSDLVPAFRFARREGVRVILDHLGHGVRRELKVHSDLILESAA